MAQKVVGLIKLQIPAGKATPAPPVGPALGQHGVNIMSFTKEFNERTKNDAGLIIPVVITVYEDRSFTFVTKTPPAAVLIKKACGIDKASGVPNKNKVATISKADVQKIAETKMPDLNAANLESAMSMIAGTARHGYSSRRLIPLWEEVSDLTTGGNLIMKHGKKYTDGAKLIDRSNLYDSKEALDLTVKTATAKFDETVEVHIRLGVDSRHADQQVRGAVILPNGTGKDVKVAVFAKGDLAKAATEAGADVVGDADLVQKIQGGWMDFDVAIASPDMMGFVGRLGKVLGPRGLMPSPKAGTVTMDVAKAVQEAKAGKIEYRLDKTNIIHCPIGKASFGTDKLLENFNALLDAIIKAKPASSKGQYIKSVAVASTMGPGVKINPNKVGTVASAE